MEPMRPQSRSRSRCSLGRRWVASRSEWLCPTHYGSYGQCCETRFCTATLRQLRRLRSEPGVKHILLAIWNYKIFKTSSPCETVYGLGRVLSDRRSLSTLFQMSCGFQIVEDFQVLATFLPKFRNSYKLGSDLSNIAW